MKGLTANCPECKNRIQLKTRLSTISLELGGATTYTVALTGGSINFENNNTFHNRTQLGETTVPVGHYTGNREITGDLDFYLRSFSQKKD